jgi:hypothetical protein
MTTKPTTRRKFRRIYAQWDIAEETGRKIGVCFVVFPLYVTLHVHRPTPLRPEWVGFSVFWKGEPLLNTFPLPNEEALDELIAKERGEADQGK